MPLVQKSVFQNIPRYQTFRKILTEKPDGEETALELDAFLSLIGIADSIDCIMMTIGNFKAIALISEKICGSSKWANSKKNILKHQQICDLAFSNRVVIKKRAIRLVEGSAKKNRNSNFRSKITTAPLFATLSYLPNNRRQTKIYFQLLAQLLVAKLLVDQKKGNLEEELQAALTSARSITSYDILGSLPEEPVQPEEYLQKLKEINNHSHVPRLVEFLSKALILAKTFTLRQLEQELFSGKKKEQDIKPTDSFMTPDLTEEFWPDILEEKQEFNDGEPQPQSGLVFLVAKPEMPPLSKTKYFDIAMYVAKSRAMDNQLFHFSWNTFNQHDIRSLFKFFNDEPLGAIEGLPALRAMIALIFLAGLPPEKLGNLKVSDASGLPTATSDLYIPSLSTIRLYSPGPEYKSELSQAMLAQTAKKQTHIDLSLPEFYSRLINTHIQRSPPADNNLIFSDLSDDFKRDIARVIKRLGTVSGARLTVTKLQHYMERKLAALAWNDIAGASLTIGKDLYLARTKVHYAGLDIAELNRLYCQANQEIFRTAGIETVHPVAQIYSAPAYVGTPIRPRIEVIQDLISRLKDELRTRKTENFTLEKLIEYHNIYTLYTAILIAYSAGYRAVNAPYIIEEMYDEETGFCVIRDKDSINFYHSHLTWLCHRCQRQLALYRAHISKIKGLSRKPISAAGNKDTEFFFLSPEGKRESATRSKIEQHLCKFDFHLPSRVQRQFLKSELQEKGCPGEIIEIMLGHWHLGQEAWVANSALHPLYFKETLQTFLEPLLNRIGLEAIIGLEKIPEGIEFDLHEITSLERELKNQRNKKRKVAKTNAFFSTHKPGEAWFKVLGNFFQNAPADKAFKPEEQFVLLRIHALMPKLFTAEEGITIPNEIVTKIINRITPKPMRFKTHNKRLNFFIDGLEWGRNNLNWTVEIPPRPAKTPKPFNLVRPSLTRKMKTYRTAEKLILKDVESAVSKDPLLQIGQIIVSAILFGGINREDWAEALLRGLSSNIYQHETLLWVDLWKVPTDDTVMREVWRKQRNASRYRRWGSDRTTQFLIYRWLQHSETDRQLVSDLRLQKIYLAYCHHIERKFKQKLPALNKLLGAANAWSTLVLPPFLSAYATNKNLIASLPDPAWMRFVEGKYYPLSEHYPGEKITHSDHNKNSVHSKDPKIFLSELRAFLNVDNSTDNKQDKIAEKIKHFLHLSSEHINSTYDLLGEWVVHLLFYCPDGLEKRQKNPERPTTVTNYLGTFASDYLNLGQNVSLYELDDEEYAAFWDKLIENIKKRRWKNIVDLNETQRQRLEYIVERLNQFLEFLHVIHEFPDSYVAIQDDDISIVRGTSVRAGIMTPAEYQQLLLLLGWRKDNLSRFEKMVILLAIFAYRTGMRLSEIYGLLIRDIQGVDQVEALVQRNWIRELKTEDSRRRVLLYLLPAEELSFVMSWFDFRDSEIGTTRKSPLFTSGPMEPDAINKEELAHALRFSIKQVTGDPTADIHMLRHTFYCLLIPKLILRDDMDKSCLPSFLSANEFGATSRKKFKQALLENETSGRKAIYAGSALLGHADTETGLTSYFHLADWLTWHFLKHPSCTPKLSAKAISQITQASEATVYRKIDKGENPLESLLPKRAKKFSTLLKHPVSHLSADRPIQPPSQKPEERFEPFDVALHRIHTNLPKDLSFRWPKMRAEMWLLQSLYHRLVRCAKSDPFTASEIFLNRYKDHDKGLLIDSQEEGQIIIDLFQNLSIEFEVAHYQSRWDKQQTRSLTQKIWEEKLGGIEIVTGKNNCGRNLGNGLVRIFIHNLTISNYVVEFEPKIATLLKITALMVSRQK